MQKNVANQEKILVRMWVAKFQGALIVSAEQFKVSNIAKSSRGPRYTSHDNEFNGVRPPPPPRAVSLSTQLGPAAQRIYTHTFTYPSSYWLL